MKCTLTTGNLGFKRDYFPKGYLPLKQDAKCFGGEKRRGLAVRDPKHIINPSLPFFLVPYLSLGNFLLDL